MTCYHKEIYQEISVQELTTSIYGDSDNQSHEIHKSAILTILGTFCENLTVKVMEQRIKLDISNFFFQSKRLLLQLVNSFLGKQTLPAVHENLLFPWSCFPALDSDLDKR